MAEEEAPVKIVTSPAVDKVSDIESFWKRIIDFPDPAAVCNVAGLTRMYDYYPGFKERACALLARIDHPDWQHIEGCITWNTHGIFEKDPAVVALWSDQPMRISLENLNISFYLEPEVVVIKRRQVQNIPDIEHQIEVEGINTNYLQLTKSCSAKIGVNSINAIIVLEGNSAAHIGENYGFVKVLSHSYDVSPSLFVRENIIKEEEGRRTQNGRIDVHSEDAVLVFDRLEDAKKAAVRADTWATIQKPICYVMPETGKYQQLENIQEFPRLRKQARIALPTSSTPHAFQIEGRRFAIVRVDSVGQSPNEQGKYAFALFEYKPDEISPVFRFAFREGEFTGNIGKKGSRDVPFEVVR